MIMKLLIEMVLGMIVDKIAETAFVTIIEPLIIQPLGSCKIGSIFAGAIY